MEHDVLMSSSKTPNGAKTSSLSGDVTTTAMHSSNMRRKKKYNACHAFPYYAEEGKRFSKIVVDVCVCPRERDEGRTVISHYIPPCGKDKQ